MREHGYEVEYDDARGFYVTHSAPVREVINTAMVSRFYDTRDEAVEEMNRLIALRN